MELIYYKFFKFLRSFLFDLYRMDTKNTCIGQRFNFVPSNKMVFRKRFGVGDKISKTLTSIRGE